MTAPRLLLASEVADLLREDLSTIRRQTRRGELPGAINLGTTQRPKWRYDAKALDAWLESRRTGIPMSKPASSDGTNR